jgi:hypothetical protein
MIRFTCRFCKKLYNAPDEYAGKKTACKKCGEVVIIPDPTGEPPGPQQEAVGKAATKPPHEQPIPTPDTATQPPADPFNPDPTEHTDQSGDRCEVILFACPNPDCRRSYRVASNRAGQVTTCLNPGCRWRIIVPSPPPEEPPDPVMGDLIDPETGATVRDWRAEVPPASPPSDPEEGARGDPETPRQEGPGQGAGQGGVAPPRGPGVEVRCEPGRPRRKRRRLTGERCYDCGSAIADGELVRRNVAVGSSYVPSDGGQGHHGRFITHHGRVSLCKRCDEARDRFNTVVGLVILCVLGVIVVFFICGGLASMGGGSQGVVQPMKVESGRPR